MKTGMTFERDGIEYKVIESDIEYKKGNKQRCILPHGRNPISIKTALDRNLIAKLTEKELSVSGELFDSVSTCAELNDGTLKDKYPPAIPKSSIKDDKIFYLPVDKLRAEVFFAHGLIYPAMYDKARLDTEFNDLQSSTPGELNLFSMPQAIPHGHLQLCLLLNSTEVDEANTFDKGLRIRVPLPISRIVNIQVNPKVKDIDHFLAGWIKPDVPVPKHLFTRTEENSPNAPVVFPSNNQIVKSDSIADAIRKFDRQMGALAFLRNAGRYLSEKTGEYSEYPSSYFALAEKLLETSLSLPNSPTPPFLALQIFGLAPDVNVGELDKGVLSLIKKGSCFIDKETARKCAKEIHVASKDSAKEGLALAFNILFQKEDYRTAIKELQSPELPTSANILAMLYKYSNCNDNDHKHVKQSLHKDWFSQDRMEASLCALGAYYGYTALSARETALYSVHPKIRSFVETSPPIKFDLSSCFERKLIEAVYQRCFFDTSNLQDRISLYKTCASKKETQSFQTLSEGPSIRDDTYSVHDLVVRKYTVSKLPSQLEQVIDNLLGWGESCVDEKSETGKYLLSFCFFHAEFYSISKEGDKHVFRYRIPMGKLILLLSQNNTGINLNILQAAVNEDVGHLANDSQ